MLLLLSSPLFRKSNLRWLGESDAQEIFFLWFFFCVSHAYMHTHTRTRRHAHTHLHVYTHECTLCFGMIPWAAGYDYGFSLNVLNGVTGA